MSDSLWPHGLYSSWNSPGQNTGVSNLSLLQRIFPTQGLNPGQSPTLQEDSLPAEPQAKPKNTGMGSLSPLQQFFPTQELNRGLLHCRRILYQLSYEGSQTACTAGDPCSIPGSGRSPGEGNGNPLQYSCLENPMDGGAWWATVYGIAKNWIWPINWHFISYMEQYIYIF